MFQLLDGSDTGMTVRVRVVRVTPLIYDESTQKRKKRGREIERRAKEGAKGCL